MLATDSTAPRISNSWSAQCRNDDTVVSLWCRDVMRCAPVVRVTIRLLKHSKNKTVKSVGSNTRTRQVLVMGVRK